MRNNQNLINITNSLEDLLNKIKKENVSFDYKKYQIKYNLLRDYFKDYIRSKRKNDIIFIESNKLKIVNHSQQLKVDKKLLEICFDEVNYKSNIDQLMRSVRHDELSLSEQVTLLMERGSEYSQLIKDFNGSGGYGYYDYMGNYKISNLKTYNDILKHLKELIENGTDVILIENKEKHFDENYKYFISFVSNSYLGGLIDEKLSKYSKDASGTNLQMLPLIENIISKDEILSYEKEYFRLYSSVNKTNEMLKNHYSVVYKEHEVNAKISFAAISTVGSGFKFPFGKFKYQTMILSKI